MTTKHQILPILLFFVLFNLSLTQAQTLSAYYDKYIMFHWKGALTSHSITIKTFPQLENLQKDSYKTFLVLYEYIDTTQTQVDQIIPVNFVEATHPVTETPIDQLNPATNYKYAYIFSTKASISAEDFDILFSVNQMTEFSFSTFGIALQPFNFTFGAASCADTGSSSPVFNYIQAENLDFFLHLGDMHYGNIDQNDTELFYEAYYAVFNSSTQKPFYQNTPLFYIWDDHDFGPDNSVGTSPSRPAVDTVYKAIVPYGPLKAALPEDDSQVFAAEGAPAAITDSSEYNLTYPSDDPYGIFRSFIIGRCLFIIMDLRSFKDVIYDDILGNEQKIWLENQFIFASLNDQVRMVFLVSSMFWIDNNNEGEWSAYPDTQQLISEYARKYVYSAEKDIMMISGDTHALGFDDGRNNFNGGFPVLQSAPLDSFPICAGGPYSHGIEVDRGQYSIIQVEDSGNDTVCVKLQLQKLGVTLIAYDTCNKDLYPGSAGVSCPKLIVGGEDEYGFVTFIIFGVIVVGIIGGFIAWFCLKKYRGRRGSGESEDSASVELLDVSAGRKKTT